MIVVSNSHQLRHIYFVLQEDTDIDIAVWKAMFSSIASVDVVKTLAGIDADAQLTSIMACERYGCPTGLYPNTWGQMYIYDDWDFEFSEHCNPRYYISNAIWSEEPVLVDAIHMRLDLLFQTLTAFNQKTDAPITTVVIQNNVLGFWKLYPYEIQLHAVKHIYDIISQYFMNR
jgi:hypothetical protein